MSLRMVALHRLPSAAGCLSCRQQRPQHALLSVQCSRSARQPGSRCTRAASTPRLASLDTVLRSARPAARRRAIAAQAAADAPAELQNGQVVFTFPILPLYSTQLLSPHCLILRGPLRVLVASRSEFPQAATLMWCLSIGRLWEPDPEKLHDEMIARFKAADLDGNGGRAMQACSITRCCS